MNDNNNNMEMATTINNTTATSGIVVSDRKQYQQRHNNHSYNFLIQDDMSHYFNFIINESYKLLHSTIRCGANKVLDMNCIMRRASEGTIKTTKDFLVVHEMII